MRWRISGGRNGGEILAVNRAKKAAKSAKSAANRAKKTVNSAKSASATRKKVRAIASAAKKDK